MRGLDFSLPHHTILRASLLSFSTIYTADWFTVYFAPQCILDLPDSSYTIFSEFCSALASLGALYSLTHTHTFLLSLSPLSSSFSLVSVLSPLNP